MPVQKTARKKVAFAIKAPEAQSVVLVADFTDWMNNPVKLLRQKSGLWKATVALAPGSYQYRFMVDGQWRNDPECPVTVPNPFGTQNCVRTVS